ncbi:MAG TPA: 4-hydroxybenzoate 3-monooxygenase [Acidimicrobiia bacterium]|jgi:p-hydroxybenzoate 3-monooxygenase
MRTKVAIIGGGPSGLFLSQLLDLAGVESTVLEVRSRDYVMGRIRAGVLEQGSAESLRAAGVSERIVHDGFVHEGINLAFSGGMFRIDFAGLVDRTVIVYGQTEVQKDLFAARDARAGIVIDEADDVRLHDVESDAPWVTFRKDGLEHRIDCDFIAGCDGSHGVSQTAIPGQVLRTFERVYPFGWLGVLSETPPVNDELIYANHERGFALCSMRHEALSRYYIQCPIDTDIGDWDDDRFWDELRARLPPAASDGLVTGPSIEKSITPLRSYVAEPMSFGKLYLAGDAAHVVPPTGAKGLNLALTDVVYLSGAIAEFYEHGSTAALDGYSDTALRRVWKAVRFSWWMTTLMHRFADGGEFGFRLQEAELDYLSSSAAAQRALAENYTGLPL